MLRAVFPRLYAAALDVCETAEEAALIAQVAFLRSYRVGIEAPASQELVAQVLGLDPGEVRSNAPLRNASA